jgi:hypothetical protein
MRLQLLRLFQRVAADGHRPLSGRDRIRGGSRHQLRRPRDLLVTVLWTSRVNARVL